MLGIKLEKLSLIPPLSHQSMKGAGVFLKGKEFITHTTLPIEETAFYSLVFKQKAYLALAIVLIIFLFSFDPLGMLVRVIAVLSLLYFLDVLFNLYLIVKSLSLPVELKFTNEELQSLNGQDLPIYTILCPLYKEANVVDRFLSAIDKLDWPKDKLNVILLLEEDDLETKTELLSKRLPDYIMPAIVPLSEPKTKPKACNYGLTIARGEYLVIYDAEDEPDPQQLKKAYLGFSQVSPEVICLQAKLNYYNPKQNLLTRLFTAEYSLWFDIFLTGLQSIDTFIPLGGTSNHFRKDDLLKLQGWDAFNVTEDADLGVRLFKAGYKTAIIDSLTLEEANSRVGNWIRQRSRWTKGYIQTYFVHTRNPIQFFKEHGVNAWCFQFLIGGKIMFMYVNPILWVTTFSYFAFNALVGSAIESVYQGPVFYIAISSFVFGNLMFFYSYMIACAKRSQWDLLKYLIFVPAYWLLITIAAYVALYQFVFKPHYWEKTIHGLDARNPIDLSGRLVAIEPDWRQS